METHLARARAVSVRMRQAMFVLQALVAAIALWFVFKASTDGPWLARTLYARFGGYAPFRVSALQAALFILVALLQTAAILAGLANLSRVFGRIAATGGLDIDTALQVRRAGFAFGIAALILVLSTPLDALIASIGQPEGQRFLTIGLETQHLLALLLSAVLVTLGHVLALAADIAEDHRQIV